MKRFVLFLSLLVNTLDAQAPTPQPEPSATVYDVGQLSLFPTYTQASYKAATGVAAPPFDVTKAPKNWYDTSGALSTACMPGATVIYQSLQQFSEVPFTIPACDAQMTNLPPDATPSLPAALTVVDDGARYAGLSGLDVYLQNVVRTAELGNGSAPINPSTIVETVASGPFGTAPGIAAAAEAKCASLTGNNQMFNGGLDPACSSPGPLIAKYSASLEAWASAAQTVQVEMGLVPGTPCLYCAAIARPPVPMPVRPLYPDERVQIGGLMGGVLVSRVPAAPAAPAAAPSSDATSAAILAIVTDIQARLKMLMGQ